MDHFQHGLDLGEQLPPLPVSDEEVFAHVALDHSECQSLLLQFLVLLPHQVPAAVGLQLGDDDPQSLVPHVLQAPQHASLEEDLAVTHAVLSVAQLHLADQQLSGLAAVEEASRDGLGSKDGVPASGKEGEERGKREGEGRGGQGRREEEGEGREVRLTDTLINMYGLVKCSLCLPQLLPMVTKASPIRPHVNLPLPELVVEEAVGESFAADPDALQHTIAPQLVENKVGVDDASSLHLVGDDAADKVRVSASEGGHQVVQGLLSWEGGEGTRGGGRERGSFVKFTRVTLQPPSLQFAHVCTHLVSLPDSDELRPLALPLAAVRTADVVGPDLSNEWVRGLLQQLHHRVVQRVLVLVQPALNVVGHLK